MMLWSFRGRSLALRFLMAKKSCRKTLECVVSVVLGDRDCRCVGGTLGACYSERVVALPLLPYQGHWSRYWWLGPRG